MATKTKKITRSRRLSHTHPSYKHPPKHFIKVYWPYIPVIALVVAGLIGGVGLRPPSSTSSKPAVLAYASEMSRSGLLSSTNQERTSRGLAALTINDKLNQAAQTKADDMVGRDYWSHNTPDGQEPWVFIVNTGYKYQKAGENLAYGFSSSSSTVTGWMNSDGHRANILDSAYKEVGFGYANSANYVGTGNETVVVAMYANPQVLATESPAPAPASASTKKPAASAPAPASTPPAEETPPEEAAPTLAAEEAPPEQFTSETPAGNDTDDTRITRLQSLTGGRAPWSAAALTAVSILIVGLWLTKHAIIVRRALITGEHFVMHHPMIDVSVAVFVALAVFLSSSTGIIK